VCGNVCEIVCNCVSESECESVWVSACG
jgi:hypothetical protein